MAGPNSNFLDPLLSPTITDDGDALPRRKNLNLIGFTVADNPNAESTDVTNTGGGGPGSVIALADHNAFRALSSAPADGTVIHFQDPIGTFVYSSTEGAGQADDDITILKRTATSSGSNGRAYSVDGSVLPSVAALRLARSGKQSIVHLQAYARGGDAGGGDFFLRTVDAFNPLPTDDGGVNIRITGVSTMWWQRDVSGKRPNPRWWGARGHYEENINGQDAEEGNARIPWRAAAFVDGNDYIDFVVYIDGAGPDGGLYKGVITDYDSDDEEWTVNPVPETTVTNAAQIYAADDTDAIQAMSDYLRLTSNVFHPTGYDLKCPRPEYGTGNWYIDGTITGMPAGGTGDNATIWGNTQNDLFVMQVDELSGDLAFDHINFRNFRCIINSWDDTFNGLEAHVDFITCKFFNVSRVSANTRNGNLFITLTNCQSQNARPGMGFWAAMNVINWHGTSYIADMIDPFTAGDEGDWGDFNDGFIMMGGELDGVPCPVACGGKVVVIGAQMSPHVGGSAVDGQAYIVARRLINLTITDSRFGGEEAGCPILELQEEADPADGSADASYVSIGPGVEAVSSNLAIAVFRDACPGEYHIPKGAEVGNFGNNGVPVKWTTTSYDKFIKRNTSWFEDAIDKVGSIGAVNLARVNVEETSIFPSTQLLDASRMYRCIARGSWGNQNYDDTGTIVESSSASANTAGTNHTLHGLPSTRYYSNNGSSATGFLYHTFPNDLTSGIYTAVIAYATKGLALNTCFVRVQSGGISPGDTPLQDTDGELVTICYPFYYDSGSAPQKITYTIDIPTGGDGTAYLEVFEGCLIKGAVDAPYLPVGGVPPSPFECFGAAAWDPGSVDANTPATTTVSVTRAKLGDYVDASFSLDLQSLALRAYVSSDGTVTAYLNQLDDDAAGVDLGSGVLRVSCRRPAQ